MNRVIAISGVLLLTVAAATRADETRQINEGVIDAPVEEVWKAFATKEGLEKCVVAKADVKLCIGGWMKTHYSPQGELGDKGSIEHLILAYEPNRMLAYRCVKTPEKFPFKEAMKKNWTVIYFEPLDAGKTKLRIVGCGYDSTEESRKMKQYFDKGNAWTIDHVREKLTGKKD